MKIFIAIMLVLQSAVASGQNAERIVVQDAVFTSPSGLSLFRVTSNLATLTNFGDNYSHGSIIPQGGMEVIVLAFPKSGLTFDSIITEQTKDTRIISRSMSRLADQPSTRIVYEDDFYSFKMITTVVFVDRGDFVYKFFLTLYPEEPKLKSFEAMYDQLLGTVRFLR